MNNARRQQVQILFAPAGSGELLVQPRDARGPDRNGARVDGGGQGLAVYRFAIESRFHEQEHVLDEEGERLLSLSGRFNSVPNDNYSALTTADMKFRRSRCRPAKSVTLPRAVSALLETNRHQDDRAAAYRAFHQLYADDQKLTRRCTTACCSATGLCAGARLRDHAGRGAARQQHPDVGRREPDCGDQAGSGTVAPLSPAATPGARPRHDQLFDVFVPLVELESAYPYDEVGSWIVESVAPLGREYQRRVAKAFDRRWIDVFENTGKRSGAYSAPCTGRTRTCC